MDGLKKEDFELRVDGRAAPISFFENIVAGSRRDRLARASAGEGVGRGAVAEDPADTAPSFRQRVVFFFLDDRHLSLDSVGRTRRMLLDFIDGEMGQDGLVAIASASGQMGFLQQFTDDREAPRAAVARVGRAPYVVADYGGNTGSPLTEHMALAIERKDDPGVFEHYVQNCLKYAPRGAIRQERPAARRH